MPHVTEAERWADLHVHSAHSLLDGAAWPEALVGRAAELGLTALALTDHDSLGGIVAHALACAARGLGAIAGVELTLDDGSHLTLLARDRLGYSSLCRLVSTAQLAGEKGAPRAALADVAACALGLECLTGCRRGRVPAAVLRGDTAGAWGHLGQLCEIFGAGHVWVEAQRAGLADDHALLYGLAQLARKARLPVVATGNAHYAHARDRDLQDVLVCIRERVPLAAARPYLRPGASWHLRSGAEMARLFADLPGALRAAGELAGRCRFTLGDIPAAFPAFPTPPGETADTYLQRLVVAGAAERYGPTATWPPPVRARMEHELEVIAQLQMADYLLAVWDIVCFARAQGILCQGRGSAVGSLVCHCLGITAVEPLAHHLSFERFLAVGRTDPPDIDLDLPADRPAASLGESTGRWVAARARQPGGRGTAEGRADAPRNASAEPDGGAGPAGGVMEADGKGGRDGSAPAREAVIQYTLARWRGHAALVSTMICFRERLALREVGQALGLAREQLDALSAQVEQGQHDHPAATTSEAGASLAALHPAAAQLALPDGRVLRRLSDLCRRIDGLPRHLGQHPGGVVLTARPLAEVAPLERARMPGRVVVQWEKESAETAGLAKIDLLGLGMLGVIDQAFSLLERETGTRPALHAFRCDDPRVYDAICALDTVGVFQIESRAQLSACLPHLQPRCYEDLIVAVALIRPGPVQGGAVHPYLRRRRGEEPVVYPGGEAGRRLLEPVLGETLGVTLFQDQVIGIGRAAGLSPGEAAELRRAMSSGRSKERMAALAARLDAGLAAHGLDAAARRTVIETVQAFSGYGFVKGHAAAFAYLSYISAWLKVYQPSIFLATLLNMQPMGFYPPEVLVQDAVRHGVRVLPVELGWSQPDCTLEDGAVRLGLRLLRGLGSDASARLEAALRTLPADYRLEELCAVAQLSEDEARALARGGALRRFYPSRRQALWQAPLVARVARERWLPGVLAAADPPVELPEASRGEELALDRAALGFSLRGHVLTPLRAELTRRSILPIAALAGLPSALVVEIAGQVMAHQRPPTAHGVLFLSLSDETAGMITVVVLPPVYARDRATLRGEALLWVTGVLERRGTALTVRAKRVRPLAALLGDGTPHGRHAPDTPPSGR